MPMPVFSGAWPPAPWDTAQSSYDLHSAWMSSDTEVLESFYSQYPTGEPPKIRPSQLLGGVRGALSRFWWGKPHLQASKRLHVPAPADVARTSADLLFGQPPQWVLSEGDATNLEAAQKRLNELLEGADVIATLLEAGALQSALGGIFLRLYWDGEVTDKVCLSAVSPDAAIPEWKYGKLAAVTFWTIVGTDKRGTWRHLERHSPGFIEHALYCGDDGNIGSIQELDAHEATEWAADLVGETGSIATGVKGLTAAYVPNIRPAHRWRNVPKLAPLGRSDFEGLESLFDALDEAWTSWMRDLELGKARLFVAQEVLDDHGPGRGASWDSEQAIFTGAPGDAAALPENGPNQLVQAQQFAIRHEEHQATCQALLNRILVSAGYSVGDFGDDQMSSMMTATEVTSREKLSNRTRASKILLWQSAMSPLARTMLELDEIVYGGAYGLKANPEMKFPVRVDQDPVQTSLAIQNLFLSEAISTEQSVRDYRPNWSSDEIDAEVKLIKAAKAAELTMVPDLPGDFAGKPADTTEQAHTDLQGKPATAAKKPDLIGTPKAA